MPSTEIRRVQFVAADDLAYDLSQRRATPRFRRCARRRERCRRSMCASRAQRTSACASCAPPCPAALSGASARLLPTHQPPPPPPSLTSPDVDRAGPAIGPSRAPSPRAFDETLARTR